MVLGRYTYVLWHIGLIPVGSSWILAREKAIFGGPFADNNRSCLRMSWVCSLTVFIPEPAISTLQNKSLVLTLTVTNGYHSMLANLAPKLLAEPETVTWVSEIANWSNTRREQKVVSLSRR